jgi:hypothetical protein
VQEHLDPNFTPTFDSQVFRSDWANHDLDMDEKFTISPDQFIHITNGLPVEGDIAIVVSYQPWIFPWKREKLFRFKTYKQTNGNLYWYSTPAN